MAIFDELKSVGKVLQEAGKIPQYQQILEVQEKLLEMQNRIAELETEKKDLCAKLEIKENLIAERNMYWIVKEEDKDGPFCTRCWDAEDKLVRLHRAESHGGIQCPKCKIWTVLPEARVQHPGIDNDWRNSAR